MLAGRVDLDELDHWVKVDWERMRGASGHIPTARIDSQWGAPVMTARMTRQRNSCV
jgi:hypothetical protein